MDGVRFNHLMRERPEKVMAQTESPRLRVMRIEGFLFVPCLIGLSVH